MADSRDDYQKLMEQKRFMGELEQGIRFANRELIHGLIPTLTKDMFLSFAVSVGRLRAEYLHAAFVIAVQDSGKTPPEGQIHDLRTRREMFEEARAAFEALRDSIEKGYVDVEGLGNAKAKPKGKA
jgi:hypothetical protein